MPPVGPAFPARRVAVLLVLQLAVLAGLALWRTTSDGAGRRPGARVSATTTPAARTHRFDVARALRTVRLQLAAGQRPAGSPQLRRVAVRLRALLPHGRFEAVPGSAPGRPLRNVVGELPGTEPAIVLGAHYETINRPKGFVGANDAAAAVGALVEIARVLRHADRGPDAPAIKFVLFDGEEELAPTDDFYADALRGSKAYMNAHAGQVRAMLLLDYMGNKDVRLPREATSDVALWKQVRAAARRVGTESIFPSATETGILDDHTPFLRAGVPAVDFIDWSYPVAHTLDDNYDHLSAAAIDAVGETVTDLLLHWPRSIG
jgi:glutaminyl-peptide cyclotransferase